MAYIEKSEEICNFHLSNLRKSAFESAANCAMESVSPRTAGGRPVSSMADSMAARSSSEKAERSAFESVFRRWANAARTVRKKSFSSSTLAGGAARRSMRTTALVTFGCGIEAVRRHVKEKLRLGVPLHEHGEGSVLARAGRGAQPLRDFLLDHHGDALKAARLEKGGDERRRHVVRQIGAHLPRSFAERFGADGRQIRLERVGKNDRHIIKIRERFAEHAPQPLVQLNGP